MNGESSLVIIWCEYKDIDNYNGVFRYCKHRNALGQCSLDEINMKNGPEGYAMFEACCDEEYAVGKEHPL